jgi:hypothetical protein
MRRAQERTKIWFLADADVDQDRISLAHRFAGLQVSTDPIAFLAPEVRRESLASLEKRSAKGRFSSWAQGKKLSGKKLSGKGSMANSLCY